MTELDLGGPGPAPQALDRIEAALVADRLEDAVSLAQSALAQGFEHPLALNLAAFDLERRGQPAGALDLLHRALELSPTDVSVLSAIGNCLSKLGRPEEAIIAFDSALDLQPDAPLAHNGKGLALETLGDLAGAERCQKRAVALDPGFAAPLGALAVLALRAGDDGAAKDYAGRALGLDPAEVAATLTLATLDMRQGDTGGVRERVRVLLSAQMLSPFHRASAQRLHADALDAEGRFDEALTAYEDANAQLNTLYADRYASGETEVGVALCARLSAYFADAEPTRWRGAPGSEAMGAGARGHAFLVGFPRSGTTLLEQVLASHPDVVALEERPTLGDVQPLFADDQALDRLADLDAASADAWRQDYWRRVAGFGVEVRDKVFVDKLPLNSLWLPYIAKLFPDARILFAIRDPRDVVLSCFRRRFVVNDVTYHFTDLEGAARFYDGVMTLSDLYRTRLGQPWRVCRHERLVEAFDPEAAEICSFLGLDWTPALRDFAETAKRRDVRTPSAPQVRRGLYREGMGQWRAYASGMRRALPHLEPWVERFGYPAS